MFGFDPAAYRRQQRGGDARAGAGVSGRGREAGEADGVRGGEADGVGDGEASLFGAGGTQGERLRAAEARAAEAEQNAGVVVGGVGAKRRYMARIVVGRGKGLNLCNHAADAGCACWSLIGPRGIKALYDATSGKRVRRRITGAKGRELDELDEVLGHVRAWHASAFPKKTFEAFALALEPLGKRPNVQAHLEGLKELGFGLKSEADVIADMKYMMGDGPDPSAAYVPLHAREEEGEGADGGESGDGAGNGARATQPWGPDAPTPDAVRPSAPSAARAAPAQQQDEEEDFDALLAAEAQAAGRGGDDDTLDAYQEEEDLLNELGF